MFYDRLWVTSTACCLFACDQLDVIGNRSQTGQQRYHHSFCFPLYPTLSGNDVEQTDAAAEAAAVYTSILYMRATVCVRHHLRMTDVYNRMYVVMCADE